MISFISLLMSLFLLEGAMPVIHTGVPTDEGSTIAFSIKNFGVNVKGSFSGVQGTVMFDPSTPSKTFIDVSIDAGTISTGISMRDSHLRKKEFFDVENYPRISFTSHEVMPGENSMWVVKGALTIKDVTSKISFPFTHHQLEKVALFKGEFEIDRRLFHVGGNSLSMGDKVMVKLVVRVIEE